MWEVESISYAELQDWLLYVRQNGPLNPMIRMEAAIGRALLPFLRKGTKLKDVMPWPREAEPTPEAIAQALMAAFRAGGGTGGKMKYRLRKKHG